MSKVLLYSGGMDSWLIDKLWKPDIKLYIDIDGSYSAQEISLLSKDVKIIHFPLGQFEQESKFIPLRNLYFLMLASNYGDEICLGATAGDWGSKDKTPEFFDKAEEMLNFLLQKQSKVANSKHIKIEREYLYKYKDELVKEYLDKGGTLEAIYNDSFSCFNPCGNNACYSCKPCFRKYVCLAYYGYQYSKEERKKMYDFVRAEIVPYSRNKNATYYLDRGSEGEKAKIIVDRLYEEFGGNIENDRQN